MQFTGWLLKNGTKVQRSFPHTDKDGEEHWHHIGEHEAGKYKQITGYTGKMKPTYQA
jgi:hypothetical protein